MTVKLALLLLISQNAVAAAGPIGERVVGKFAVKASEGGLLELCRRTNTPCGALIDLTRPFSGRDIISNSSSTTLAEALALFMGESKEYRWQEDRGTIRIQPIRLQPDVVARFYKRSVIRDFKDNTSHSIGAQILGLVGINTPISPGTNFDYYAVLTLNINAFDVLTALDQVVAADGQAIWFVKYTAREAGFRYSYTMNTWRTVSQRSHPK